MNAWGGSSYGPTMKLAEKKGKPREVRVLEVRTPRRPKENGGAAKL